MKTTITSILFCILFCCGCRGNGDVRNAAVPNAEVEKLGPLVVRAALLERCPVFGEEAQVEATFLLGGVVASLLASAADELVDRVADAISKAAEEDRETFTITGLSAEYLYTVRKDKKNKGEVVPNQCVVVAVAPKLAVANACSDGEHWYGGAARCGGMGDLLEQKFTDWSLGAPAFYGEWLLRVPKDGPATHVLPTLVKLHYPTPLSDRQPEKIKGITVLVEARDPTSSRAEGDLAFELFYSGEGMAPGQEVTVSPKELEDGKVPPYGGRWLALPEKHGAMGVAHGGPVNLTATVSETPHQTEWLQILAKFVNANRDKAKAMLKKEVSDLTDTKKKAEDERKSFDVAIASKEASNNACRSLLQKITAAASALKSKNTAEGATAKLEARLAHENACLAVDRYKRDASDAWSAAGRSELLCDSQELETMRKAACSDDH